MPHTWNNILVVTKDELVPAFYNWDKLKRTIRQYENKPYGIKSFRVGGEVLVYFDSLDGNIKNAIGDPRKCDHILERYYKIDSEAVIFYSTYQFEDNSYLSLEHQEKYIINASVLRGIIALKAAFTASRYKIKSPFDGMSESICADATGFNKTLLAKHKVQHTLSDKKEVFSRTLIRFEKEGYKALISGKHGNQNASKVKLKKGGENA